MTPALRDVFADSAFWIALIVKRDRYHDRSQKWALRVGGRITTTSAVLLETANSLSRPAWRGAAIALIDHLQQRDDVEIAPLTAELWQRAWELFRGRVDKAWSLTDCLSFVVMQDAGLFDALTSDEHFRQAGMRAILLEEP